MSKLEVDISLNIFGAIGGQKRVVGVNFGSTNAKRDIPIYAELYLQGRMNLDDLVSREISLRDVNDGYAALKDGSLTRLSLLRSDDTNIHKETHNGNERINHREASRSKQSLPT